MKDAARLLLVALCLAACGPPPASTLEPKETWSPDTPSPASAAAEAPGPAEAHRAPIVNSNNAFAASVWGVLRARPGNLAVSPASLTMALAMTFGGARGETATEMGRVLHFEVNPDEVMRSASDVQQGWSASHGPTVLYTVNRLFGANTYTFEKSFVDIAQHASDAPLEAVDFAKRPEQARRYINGWVEEETEHHINDLVPRAGVDHQTRLVLVNAIYFKAEWANPFEVSATRPGPFHVTRTNEKDVPMMHNGGIYRFASPDGVQIIEMPYKGNDASMVILLPDAVDGLPALEQTLTAAALDTWLGALKRERVDLSLPRFEVNPPSAISLRDTLRALGMRLAFDPMKADFTGMANPQDPKDRLYLRDVFHKAVVKLDEKGTEAFAGTAALNSRGGKRDPKVFRADHPFLFVLRDTRTGMILFMGRVADPSSKDQGP